MIAPDERYGTRIAMMPLRGNVPVPRNIEDWTLAACPHCGRACWYQRENGERVKAIWPNTVFLCTECALAAGQNQREK
jgi:hypothetical protein